MVTLNPYLNFGGNCEAAFEFYRSVFGGQFADVQRFSAMPPDSGVAPEDAQRLMHIALPIGPNGVLMGSDRLASMGPITAGDNYHLSLQTDDEAEATRLFNSLAAGGQVIMPLAPTFWNARFGMLIDQFGVQWMINQAQAPQ